MPKLLYPKPTKKKKTRKVELRKGYWKKKADTLQSLIVRKIGKCEWCGHDKNLQAAHVVSRSNIMLRYDIQNFMCLCAGCHLKWHHDPLSSMLWFNSLWPERVAYLQKEKNKLKKMTINDYKDLIKKLENYL